MKSSRQLGITLDVQTPVRNGVQRARYADDAFAEIHSSPAQALLGELLASSIVLTEDFEKLSAHAQDEIRQCSETRKLLPVLVEQ